jgi:geranylgeranyl diphosphate synthase type II
MTAATQGLAAWLDARRAAVDEALERFVPPDRQPAVVWEAMRYSLFAGGKRLRPMLTLAAAEATAERLHGSATQALSLALPAACALELIHTYSLVHDDLPAMDDDTLRRGRPTAHVVYGEGLAILAGDALLTEAFALLAREPQTMAGTADDVLSSRKIAALTLIATAAGGSGMVGGQAIDLRAADGSHVLDADSLRDMHARKTGALIQAAAVAGAVMAGANADLRAAVGAFAEQVGLAFQIVDDILDVEGASADLGKTAGKDAAAGKPTYPALYGLEGSRRLAAECIDRALTALARVSLGGHLPDLARWGVDRRS